jgi:1,2-diacylglycerol 3-alpha-glucosyltransferase
MKIAIVVPIMGNFGKRGFYHSQEIGLGKELARKGNAVTVYKCVSQKHYKKIEMEIHGNLKIMYIPTRSIGTHGLFKPSLIEKNTDTVFVFSDTQLITKRLYNYCKKNKIKFIPYIGIAHSFKKNIKSKIMDIVFRLMTLKVYRKVKVFAKTNTAMNELKSLGVNDCVVAPVGLDFESLKGNFENFSRSVLRKKWGFNKNDVIISFIARLYPEKKPLELIEIFENVTIKNKKLLIVGEGPLKYEIERRLLEKGLDKEITIIPRVKYDEIWEIHYISDYFLNLRSDEIFGMAMMEAIFYKSCVLAISAPGPDTILCNMKSHKLCKSIHEIINLINKQNINESLLIEDQQFLKKNFSWESCAELILNL